jgi:hypothetical protein
VALYRNLARGRPDAFRPDLVASLNTLAIRLSNLGRREPALAAAEEAAALYIATSPAPVPTPSRPIWLGPSMSRPSG